MCDYWHASWHQRTLSIDREISLTPTILLRHTVSMSQRRVPQSYGLPQNPTWLAVNDFPKSDGTESQYPTALSETSVDESGRINYYVPTQNDDSICIRWRKELGDALAKHRRLPANKAYVLSTFPEGYKIFVQNKAQAGGKIRQDIYLYGQALLCSGTPRLCLSICRLQDRSQIPFDS